MADLTRCGVTAPHTLWGALGWEVYQDSTEVMHSRIHADPHELDALVYEGRRVTGKDTWEAVSWAVAEQARRHEAKTAATAQAREAEAITKLANSLRSEMDEAVLGRILPRLTERTQYAVRAQLKQRPL